MTSDALAMEAMLAREDKPIIFDLSQKNCSKLDLNNWFKNFSPNKIRRSDGVGWIMVISETATQEERKKMLETDESVIALRAEWTSMIHNVEAPATGGADKDGLMAGATFRHKDVQMHTRIAGLPLWYKA